MRIDEEVARLQAGRREVLVALRRVVGLRLHPVEDALQALYEVLLEELDAVVPAGSAERRIAVSEMMEIELSSAPRRVSVSQVIKRLKSVKRDLAEVDLATVDLGVDAINVALALALAQVDDALDRLEG